MEDFRDFLQALHYPVKVVVAGNHELTFHESYYQAVGKSHHVVTLPGMGGMPPVLVACQVVPPPSQVVGQSRAPVDYV